MSVFKNTLSKLLYIQIAVLSNIIFNNIYYYGYYGPLDPSCDARYAALHNLLWTRLNTEICDIPHSLTQGFQQPFACLIDFLCHHIIPHPWPKECLKPNNWHPTSKLKYTLRYCKIWENRNRPVSNLCVTNYHFGTQTFNICPNSQQASIQINRRLPASAKWIYMSS